MVDKKFSDAVSKGNITEIRDMLRNRIQIDHDVVGGMFRECFDYCRNEGILDSLYEKQDNREIPSENTEENFKKLVGQLSTNFSRARLEKVIEIAKIVWADEQSSDKQNTASSSQNLRSENGRHDYNTGRVLTEDGGRIIGEERILSETPLYDDDESRGRCRQGPQKSQQTKTDSKINPILVAGAVVVVVAAVVAAVVAG